MGRTDALSLENGSRLVELERPVPRVDVFEWLQRWQQPGGWGEGREESSVLVLGLDRELLALELERPAVVLDVLN